MSWTGVARLASRQLSGRSPASRHLGVHSKPQSLQLPRYFNSLSSVVLYSIALTATFNGASRAGNGRGRIVLGAPPKGRGADHKRSLFFDNGSKGTKFAGFGGATAFFNTLKTRCCNGDNVAKSSQARSSTALQRATAMLTDISGKLSLARFSLIRLRMCNRATFMTLAS